MGDSHDDDERPMRIQCSHVACPETATVRYAVPGGGEDLFVCPRHHKIAVELAVLLFRGQAPDGGDNG